MPTTNPDTAPIAAPAAAGSKSASPTVTLGVIISNRDFFPDVLVGEARKDIKALLDSAGIKSVMLTPEQSKLGGVETHADARRCAELFRQHRDVINGILVLLPNFGDEKGVADTLKLSKLNVPVLIQAYPDDLNALGVARRRDAFCGKISVCNNLKQANIPFTLTTRHVVHPNDPTFKADLARFISVCRVVGGLRGARFGAVGARPGAFNTVRYSEKILERYGISVTTVDLSEILGNAGKLAASDARVKAKLDEINAYAPSQGVPADKMLQMSRLGVVLDDFIAINALDSTAIQCWTSLQQNWGCNVCTCMSMMSQKLMPSACEVDITGALSMYALSLGYRMRYVLDLNAREAMQLIELRSGREGHPSYRAVAHAMHERIAAVHPAVAAAMTFVDRATEPRLERIVSELRTQAKLDAR